MYKYIKKNHHLSNWKYVVREMFICIKLIDIILEEDKYYESWLHNCYGSKPFKHLPFPVYVNLKNCKRFIPSLSKEEIEKSSLKGHYCQDIRRVKAMYLYNKIRAYKMWGWWD